MCSLFVNKKSLFANTTRYLRIYFLVGSVGIKGLIIKLSADLQPRNASNKRHPVNGVGGMPLAQNSLDSLVISLGKAAS
jgi:hypothetical protein